MLCLVKQLLYVCIQETDSKEEQGFKSEAAHTLAELVKAVEQWETQQMLGGQYDKLGAVLSIQVCPLTCLLPVTSSSTLTECPIHVCNCKARLLEV